MRGDVQKITKVYDGKHRTLEIPVYQRNYDWTEKQCSRLFDDLSEVVKENHRQHFFGAVVGKPQGSWTWVVIDGQQRLTTISLFMLALVHSLRASEVEEGEFNAGYNIDLATLIEDDYLRSGNEGNLKFKLKPVKNDNEAYQKLFGPESEFIESSNLTANYRYFRNVLKATDLTAAQLWEAIEKLRVMYLDLEEFDDPQRIFESLNSTGLELSEADKVRNLVLMDQELKTQEKLYEQRWNPIEVCVKFDTDNFIRWYLTLKTARTPRKQDVYEEFKKFIRNSKLPVEFILDDMYEYAKLYRDLLGATTGFIAADRCLKRFVPVMGDVVLPFLLPVLKDAKDGIITESDFLGVLKVLESYLFRRFAVGVASNALSKIFSTAYSDIKKFWTPGQSYSSLLAYILKRRDGSGRFPSDSEFRENFATKNFWNIHNENRRYLFDCLENADSNDVRDIQTSLDEGSLSIEHIMPRSLNDQWRAELGPEYARIHETWINRIGNLTITGYNSAYSNSSYERKRTMENGFLVSPYRINNFIKKQKHWSEEQLIERTELLTQAALDYWLLPKETFQPPQAVLPTESLDSDLSFRGREIVAFEYEDYKETVTSWADMLQSVLKVLNQSFRQELIALTNEEICLATSNNSNSSLREIDHGLFVDTGSSTSVKIGFLRRVFTQLGLEQEALVFTLRPLANDVEPRDDELEVEVEKKYSDLTKFIPQLEEAENLEGADTEVIPLLSKLKEQLTAFSPENPQAALGGLPVPEFLKQNVIEQLSAEHILAVLTQHFNIASMMGDDYLLEELRSGRLRELLQRLEELDS